MVIVYKPTHKGIEFCRSILEPYERIFPRSKESVVDNVNSIINNASNDNSDTTETAAGVTSDNIMTNCLK
jgi:hypothetical protein